MEFILIPLAVFVVSFVVIILAAIIGAAMRKKKIQNFQKYLAEHFPQLDPALDMLVANQRSKHIKPAIALLINDEEAQIIILSDDEKATIRHDVYDYSALASIESKNTVLSRGFIPKTYSYEEMLALHFKDGKVFQFYLENVSNKYANDQGADVVRNIFKPWLEKFDRILMP